MSPEIISIVALAAMFVVATLWPINMGALAFVAAFLVGTAVVALQPEDILAGFPGNLFLILVGVTYLFGIAHTNGTVDLLIQGAVRLVGGRVAAIPWVMFFVTATLTAVGALSPAAVAIVAPIALGFAARYHINTLLMGAMVVHGAQAGGFSPVSVYGGIVQGIVAGTGLPSSPMTVFVLSFIFNFAFAFVLYLLFGWRLLGQRVAAPATTQVPVTIAGRGGLSWGATAGGPLTTESGSTRSDLRFEQVATSAGLILLMILTVGFGFHLGFVAISIAVALAILSPGAQKEAVNKISWPIVLLLGGVLTYVHVLQEAGTIDYLSDGVVAIGVPIFGALVLCYVAGLVTAFASSTAMLGVLIPLMVPFLLQGEVSAVAMVAALAISVTMPDISPFSTNGALVLANARDPHPERFYRYLLGYTGLVIVVAPLVAWAVLIFPNWL
ncbi:MAG: hypothetical protein GEU99_12330 [Luteitalea sp.]|nr:hypothetical protein [Luteitalea sp.]